MAAGLDGRLRRATPAGAAAALLLAAGCASRAFAPAGPEDAAKALAAWGRAVARAAAVPRDGNLLYEARVAQGVASTGGTLAVRLRGEALEATLSGEFGAPLATYADGVLRGEKLQTIRVSGRELRALLAGVWSEGAPEVAGRRGDAVLLRWTGEERAEAVFDTLSAETSELKIERADGELAARFTGARNPWPEKLEIAERRTKSRLTLRLLAWEPAS